MLVKYFQLFVLLLSCSSGLCAAVNSTSDDKWFRNDYTYSVRASGWFKVHPVPVNWQRARFICHYEGAELVSPTSPDMMEGIKEIIALTEPKRSNYFSGVHQLLGDGVYTSIEGVPLEKLHIEWRPNEPFNHDLKERCLEFNSEGKFNDADCDAYLPYMCFRSFSNADELTPCGTVDKGYLMRTDLEVRFQLGSVSENHGISVTDAMSLRHCYKVHRHAYTWELAHIVCQAEGGHLAVINSAEEAQLILRYVPSYSDTYAVGFREWKSDGDWWTVHGQRLEEAGFDKWGRDLPDINYPTDQTSRRQSCGGFQRGDLAKIWCDVPYSFICERGANSLNDALPKLTQKQ